MQTMFKIRGIWPFACVAFLNAFVDLGHKILIQNTVFKVYEGNLQVVLTALVNALILLPYVLLFIPAGWLSDSYPKNRVMRNSAWFAIVITVAITAFYYLGWFWPAYAMTLLLAMQSAIYSPAKYGYIKELVGREFLAAGNGLIQAVTISAILSGSLVFSFFFEARYVLASANEEAAILRVIAPLGWLLVANSVLELWLAYRLPQCSAVVAVRAPTPSWSTQLIGVMRRRNIAWPILGVTVFMTASQVMLAAFPAFAKETLGVTNTVLIQAAMAASGVGIVVGSALAARWSRHSIEAGLIPLGAVALALGLFVLPQLPSIAAHAANFFFIGIAGGLFIIPLNALMQYHAGEKEMGRVLAVNNLVQNIVMLSALVLTAAVAFVGLRTMTLLYGAAALTLVGVFVVIARMPQTWLRLSVLAALRRQVQVDLEGLNYLPEHGGVQLQGELSGWRESLILQLVCPRPIFWFLPEHAGDWKSPLGMRPPVFCPYAQLQLRDKVFWRHPACARNSDDAIATDTIHFQLVCTHNGSIKRRYSLRFYRVRQQPFSP